MSRKISTECEQFWRHHLDQQRASRLSIRNYCYRHGLQDHSFYFWRRTIAERDRQVHPASARPPAAPAFLPVALVDDQTRLPDTAIEICLVDGRRLRVHAGCDRTLLADVLAILQATPEPETHSC